MKYTRNKVTDIISKSIIFEESLKRKAAVPRTPEREKPYASELNNMGRIAYFEEYFNGVKLENQELKSVGPYKDPKETFSFKQGYQRGEVLAKLGVVPEEYQSKNNNMHK